MTFNPKTHHRRSIRLNGCDYRTAGAYFVTICTHERRCNLIDQATVGAVERAWARTICGGKTPEPYEFVVMPNHVHGIVWLPGNRDLVGAPERAKHARARGSSRNGRMTANGGSRGGGGASPLQGPAARSLGAVVGAFKSAATKRINSLRRTPGTAVWQDGFYERIVRNDRELDAIRQYILDNPAKWEEDKHHPRNWSPGS